jgi:hypothetical protein
VPKRPVIIAMAVRRISSSLRPRRQRAWAALLDGLRAILVPLCLALLGAYTFEYVIRSRIYPFYGLLYAVLFVALPYFATRAVANRLASLRAPPTSATAQS